jgi:hypothetical protein
VHLIRNPDKDWELTIGPDTVRVLVDKAKAISAALNDDYADGQEHEVELDGQSHDRHAHDGLAEEKAEDLTREEFRAMVADLNVDEAAELIALAWIGRGDYDGSEFAEAVAAARDRNLRRAASYLLGMPMLGDWLEEGLEAIGV